MPSEKSNDRLFYCITAGRLSIFAMLLCGTYLMSRYCTEDFHSATRLSFVLGAAFLLTLIYILWHKKTRRLGKGLLYVQTVLDVILVSFAVFWTGGLGSPLAFLYSLAIITACLLGGKMEVSAAAFLSTVSYAVLCWIGEIPKDSASDAAYTFFINMAAFNLIASLGIMLAQRLKHTEKRLSKARVDLRRMEEIHRHLANSIQSGLITVDERENLTFCNQAAVEILGPEINKAYGRHLEEFWPAGAHLLKNLRTHGQSERQELNHTGPNDTVKFLGISTFPLKDFQGQHLGCGMIFQDITERKAREERLQRMDRLAALGEMAAGLAHEIRNPLASISGAAQFLEETELVMPEGKRLLEIMGRESDRLNDITKSFLLYARPEGKKIQYISLLKEIESVLVLIKQRRNLPKADVKTDIPANLSFKVDTAQLTQVFLNLLLNAYQALPQTNGKISIKGRKDGDHLLLSISDNGTGIKSRDISRVFDPFFTTRPDGTGLGLAIVHRLVHEWHCEITVDSEPGKGSTFTLHLPVYSS